MAKKNGKTKKTRERITAIIVEGYKSIRDRQMIDLRPLTILAGANSSGKSSMIQPLLLLKQTLEAAYDPGPLLLNGPNVPYFTNTEQLFSKKSKTESLDEIIIGLEEGNRNITYLKFKKAPNYGLIISETKYSDGVTLRENLTKKQIDQIISKSKLWFLNNQTKKIVQEVVRDRCFIELNVKTEDNSSGFSIYPLVLTFLITSLIHIPALRTLSHGKIFPAAYTGSNFPGLFHEYVGSIIYDWKLAKDSKLATLNESMRRLNLTSKVDVNRIEESGFEIKVSRLTNLIESDTNDLVNISHVGFGVSQVLPVLVALLVAKEGQIVYLEQPEIHLHPRAQVALAELLADAAKRGVIVIAETHSDKLLLGVQTLVAEGKLDKELVKLHWFTRNTETGFTKIDSVDLDEQGRFGDWPEDFSEVGLEIEGRFLDAAIRETVSGTP